MADPIQATAPKRLMVINAHPDDAEFGCGGTLATFANAGTEVVLVIITDGSKGNADRSITPAQLIEMRIAEQDKAAAVLGITQIVRLGYEDGVLQPTLDLRRDIARVIRQYHPNVVIGGDPDSRFGGDFYINHPDHRAAAEAVLYGIFPAAGNFNFFPELLAEGLEPHQIDELWMTAWGDGTLYVDVTDAMPKKIAALAEHHSQFKIADVQEFVQSTSTEAGKKFGVGAAESFKRIIMRQPTADDIAKLAAEGEAAEIAEPVTAG